MLATPALAASREAVDIAFPEDKYPESAAAPLETVHEQFAKKPGLQAILDVWLGFFETVALTVYAGTSDEDMTYECVGGMVIRFGERFREYIKDVQKTHGQHTFCYF